jgi:flagellar biogenesis protein FliO
MIIAMILNVDLKLLALILLVVYIVVKLMKIKPWRKQQIDSLPLSFVKKKNKIRKK